MDGVKITTTNILYETHMDPHRLLYTNNRLAIGSSITILITYFNLLLFFVFM